MTISLELCVQAFGACLMLKTVVLWGLKGLGPLLASALWSREFLLLLLP